MNKLLTIAAIIVAGGLTAAHAEGGYVGLQGGIGGMNTQNNVTSTSLVNSGYTQFNSDYRKGMAYRASVGYLFGDQFSMGGNSGVGVELGYANYGNNTDTFSNYANTKQIKSQGSYFDLLAVAKFNFGDMQSGQGPYIVGKAGVARLKQKTTQIYNGTANAQFNKTKYNPEVAIGAGYNFNRNVGVDVSFHHVFADGKTNYSTGTGAGSDFANSKMADVNLLMLGINYNFC